MSRMGMEAAKHGNLAGMEKDEDIQAFERPIFSQRCGIFANPRSFGTWVNPPSLANPLTWSSLIRWKFMDEDHSRIPPDEVLQQTLPVHSPVFPVHSSLAATWLGHATLFVRIDGISLLTDPVWARFASPFSSTFICKRYRPPPCQIDQLPNIDLVLISHNHYDHLDAHAVKQLDRRFPNIRWLVPKGLGQWMHNQFGRRDSGRMVYECTWGQHLSLELGEGKVCQIYCIPAQHWSQRTAFDRNKSLWSGWLVQGPQQRKFFYTGDTGFCENEFFKLGKRFAPVQLAAIPIGCYSPRWFMHPQHIGPKEAVQIHRLVDSQKSIAVHWGTYKMGSNEHYLEPPAKLREELQEAGLSPTEFVTLEHGQSWQLEDDNDLVVVGQTSNLSGS